MFQVSKRIFLVRPASSQNVILGLLADGKPKSHREIVRASGSSEPAVWQSLRRAWERGLLLRTKKPLYEPEKLFKGRAGVRRNLRSYHLYVLKPKNMNRLEVGGNEYVSFSKRYLDARGGGTKSKAAIIQEYLGENPGRAFYSTQVAEALKEKSVRIADVMSNVRRWEKRGLVYVRGYRSNDRETPFKEGYLLTWIDRGKQRDEALQDAIERTTVTLAKQSSTSPIIERVQRIRDIIIESSKLRDLVAFDFVQNKLECSDAKAEEAVRRALQLYTDLREVKIFDAYRYFYHAPSLTEEDLKAAIGFKENYIRVTKGRANRVGHNWEAAVEWFVDKFTVGAAFREQPHRTAGMDSRRITLHLIKNVGGRRMNAEVDRVWTVTPGIFSPPTTYVLECKWGIVRKSDVDDFLNVLRWSTDFGVDTPEGRQVRQGVTGVFAASAFNPKENVRLGDQTISLASYASRLNTSLLKATDFNEKLRERGCKGGVTIQKVCQSAKDEGEVREVLDAVWHKPDEAEKTLSDVLERNEELYHFERILEEETKKPSLSTVPPEP